MRPIVTALIVAVVATGMSGCSLALVRGPELEGTHCTTSPAPAIIDTIMAVAAGIAATEIFVEVSQEKVAPGNCTGGDCSPDPRGYAVVFLGVPSTILAATFGGSAVAGFWKTGRCRAYIREEPARRERERVEMEREQTLAEQRAEQERIEREPIEREHAEQEHIRRNSLDHAFALLKTAAQAARAGDCATALDLGEQIRAENVEVWQGWFLRDLEIRRCIDAAAVAPSVTPGAQPAPSTTPQEETP